MKKLLRVTLALVLVLTLAACGGTSGQTPATPAPSGAPSTAPSSTAAPAGNSADAKDNANTNVTGGEGSSVSAQSQADAPSSSADAPVKDATFFQGFYKGIEDGKTETIDGLRLEESTFKFWIRGAAYVFEGKLSSDFYTKKVVSGEAVSGLDGKSYYASMRLNDDGTISLSLPDFVDQDGPCPLESKMKWESQN